MSEEIDYAARVARGIALMDVKWPAWATEIDLEKLDIEDSSCCVTAQYAAREGAPASFDLGRQLLGLSGEDDSVETHGFDVFAWRPSAYAALNGLWKAEIVRRRAQGQDAPAEPEATS